MTKLPGYLSWSQLDSFAGCGRKYELSYLEKVPKGPRGYFIGGHAVHETIQESESAGWWADVARFQKGGEAETFFHLTFEKELSEASADLLWGGRKSKAHPDGENAAWWHSNGPSMLRRYSSLRREDETKGYGRPETELKVSFAGPGGKQVLGYIDQLFPPMAHQVGASEGRVRDYKTGSSTPPTPLQLALYGKAVRETMDMDVRWGEFVKLRSNDGRLAHEVDLYPWYPVLDKLMTEWDEAIRSGVYLHRPGFLCGTCDVGAYCDVGRLLGGHEEVKVEGESGDAAQAATSVPAGG